VCFTFIVHAAFVRIKLMMMIRAVFVGGLGVEPPAKISDLPAAIKKTQVGGSTFYVPMH